MLTKSEIEKQMAAKLITFDPPPAKINPNSVNLRLGPTLKMYKKHWVEHDRLEQYAKQIGWPKHSASFLCEPLDFARKEETVEWEIPKGGQILWPNLLYLGSTLEYITSGPFILEENTRSGVARMGLSTNRTAGFGDAHFEGNLVLEITVVQPVIFYPGMELCQIAFFRPDGEVTPYSGRYQGQRGPRESMTWKEFADRPESP